MGYGYDVSDAYSDYWFAGGVFALAVVADKKIKVNLRQMTVYANLYIALLGKSSLARKSTAIDKVEALLDEIWPFLVDVKVPTEFSPEAFIEHMDAHNHAPWIRDEAAGVLSLMKKDYMRGFKDSLLSLFDCKPFHRKLRTSQRKGAKTDFKVDDPYLNMLWATTGASFGANTELIDTLSGFLARFLFFFPQGQKVRWLPLEKGSALNSDLSDVVRNQLLGIANKMVDIKSPIDMDISPEANAFWANWQKVQEDTWTTSDDDFNAQIFSRMNPVVVKLSMLFELGSPDFDPARPKPIRLEFLQEACRLVDTYLMPTSRAVYDLVGSNIEKNVIDRITAYLKNHGGKSTAKEIMKNVKIKKADFDDYLDTMVEAEMVMVEIVRHANKAGRPSLWVFLIDQPNLVGNVYNVDKVDIVDIVAKDLCDSEREESETKSTKSTKSTNSTNSKNSTDPVGKGVFKPVDTQRADEPTKAKCKTVEDVVNCLDHNLTEIQNPVLADWLHKQGLPYIPVIFQLKDRGWKQDNTTRTMHKAVEAST